MSWISVKDKLPTYDSQFVIFAKWIQLDHDIYPPTIIESFAGTYAEVKIWRKWQLKNSYTHWRSIGRPPKK